MSTSELPNKDQSNKEETPPRALLMRREPGVGIIFGIRMFEGEAWLHPAPRKYTEKTEKCMAIAACVMLGYTTSATAARVPSLLYGDVSEGVVRGSLQNTIFPLFETRSREKLFGQGRDGVGAHIIVRNTINPATLGEIDLTERQWDAIRRISLGQTDEEAAQGQRKTTRSFEECIVDIRHKLPRDGSLWSRAGLGTLYGLCNPADLPTPPETPDGDNV